MSDNIIQSCNCYGYITQCYITICIMLLNDKCSSSCLVATRKRSCQQKSLNIISGKNEKINGRKNK